MIILRNEYIVVKAAFRTFVWTSEQLIGFTAILWERPSARKQKPKTQFPTGGAVEE